VGFANPKREEIASRVKGNSELATVSRISKTFSAMLDLLVSSRVTVAKRFGTSLFVFNAVELLISILSSKMTGKELGINP
jgi:hypothetical protein